jgi:phosphatidylglycerophosphate synthase
VVLAVVGGHGDGDGPVCGGVSHRLARRIPRAQAGAGPTHGPFASVPLASLPRPGGPRAAPPRAAAPRARPAAPLRGALQRPLPLRAPDALDAPTTPLRTLPKPHKNASSKFGAFLDPVADKLMVAAALILLCTQPLAAGPLAGNSWLVPSATLGAPGARRAPPRAPGPEERRAARGGPRAWVPAPRPARARRPVAPAAGPAIPHLPPQRSTASPPPPPTAHRPVIIGREITMSALREWAATLGPAARDAVAVNAWGKWKTASQMVSLTALLATRDGPPAAAVAAAAAAAAAGGGAGGALLQAAAAAGPPLLVVAAYLSAHSLALYLRGLWRFMAA